MNNFQKLISFDYDRNLKLDIINYQKKKIYCTYLSS